MVRIGVEWINNFSAGCPNPTLHNCANVAEGFLEAMTSHGHTGVFDWGDGNAWETDFRATSFGGDADNWSDDVHFCYFASHGGNWADAANHPNSYHICFSSQHYACLSDSTQWQLGHHLLRWLVLDSCQMVLGTDAASIGQWFGPMQGIHVIFGYVGDCNDDGGRGASFGNDAANGHPLADAWLGDASSWWEGENAIAIAAGTSAEDALNRRDNETIGWVDADLGGPTTWLAWKWYESPWNL